MSTKRRRIESLYYLACPDGRFVILSLEGRCLVVGVQSMASRRKAAKLRQPSFVGGLPKACLKMRSPAVTCAEFCIACRAELGASVGLRRNVAVLVAPSPRRNRPACPDRAPNQSPLKAPRKPYHTRRKSYVRHVACNFSLTKDIRHRATLSPSYQDRIQRNDLGRRALHLGQLPRCFVNGTNCRISLY